MNADKDRGAGEQAAFEDIQGVWVAPGDGPLSWTYRARAPGLAPGTDGRAQFTLIGAGTVTMLALTAMWGVPAAQLDAVRAELAARAQAPVSQIQLSPAPVEVGEVRLMIGDGLGEYVELAKVRCSGVPPYHAAFNLMLDQVQSEKVRKALNGEHGWLELRYAATDAAAARSSRSLDDSASIDVEVSLSDSQGRADASASVRSRVGVESESGYGAAQTRSYSADAADWGLPKP
ncbi:hypothetical protein [Lysobacter sp. CA199]|uniref:hypothetical protein n=1 Tax=Lysobacter sp. CA199 TaxID=3455608 RepID=UPI003F8D5BBE